MQPSISLVIACYKDSNHLRGNCLALCEYLSASKYAWEFIFVNDASPDDTEQVITSTMLELTSRGIACKRHLFETNKGRGAAVTHGIRMASGDVVGYIDIDLEPSMDGIIRMVQLIESDKADVVVGRRLILNAAAKPLRVLSSYIYRWLAHLALPLPIADTECGLKFFHRRKILPVLEQCKDAKWFWDTEVVHRSWSLGLRVSEHPIVFFEDTKKISTVKLLPDTMAYLKAIKQYRCSLRS